jgi:gliding motility-associated-like protein
MNRFPIIFKSLLLFLWGWFFLNQQANSQVTTQVYSENFNSGTGGWTIGGYAPSWKHGIPSLPNIASNGTPCFVTGDAGASAADPLTQCISFPGATTNGNFYNCCERSFVESPSIDLTGIASPMVSIDFNLHCEQTFDGAKLQISINGGLNWSDVGAYSGSSYETFPSSVNCRETNWYNKSGVNYLNSTSGGCSNVSFSFGGGNSGWSGGCGQGSGGACSNPDSHGTNGWITATHCLTQAANKPDVRLRVVFGAGSQTYSDGIGFDNVKIFNVFPVTAFTAVQNNACQPVIQFNNLTDCAANFVWDFGTSGTGNSSTAVNPLFTYDSAGTYLVTLSATDFCGGSRQITQQVFVNPGIAALIDTIYTTNSGVCNTILDSLVIEVSPAIPGFPPYNVSYNFNGISQPPVTTNNLSIVIPNIGTGVVDGIILMDGSGCELVFPNSYLIPFNSDGIAVDAGNDTTILIGNEVVLEASASLATSFSWNGPSIFTDPLLAQITAYPQNSSPYQVTATSVNGCTASDEVVVTVKDNLPCDLYYVPNSFTPNGDGKNEKLEVIVSPEMRVSEYKMDVYNRWGQSIYSSSNPDTGWDGGDAGTGIYLINVNFTCTSQKKSRFTGTVTLIK